MEVKGSNVEVATYAMKKALEMPNILVDLLMNSATAGKLSPAAASPVAPGQAPDLATVIGKGKIIDLLV